MQTRMLRFGLWCVALGTAAMARGSTPPADEAKPAGLLESFWKDTYGPVNDGAAVAPSELMAPRDGQCKPTFDIDLVAKAKPDQCFYGLCDPRNLTSFGTTYPGDLAEGACEPDGAPKVNQAYVWGLTMPDEEHVWFATAANVLCLVAAGLTTPQPFETDAVECEAGCKGPPTFTDARPPRFFVKDKTGGLVDLTAAVLARDAALLQRTYGVRSAGSFGGVVFFGGLMGNVLGGSDVVMYAFDAKTKEYLGARNFNSLGYTNIRQWIVAKKQLYTGVGVGTSAGGTAQSGKILRWTGSLAAFRMTQNLDKIFSFETVGNLQADPAYLTLHEERLVASTWGGDPAMGGFGLLLYISPLLGSDQKLTGADAAGWKIVWKLSEYEVEPTAFQVGGAIASFGGYLYFGTMQVPGLAVQVFCAAYGAAACASTQATLEATLGTLRPVVLLRGKDLGTAHQKIELLYGTPLLPKYNATAGQWEIVPNKLGQLPKFGLAGMNNPFNTYIWWAQNWKGGLYLGTFDWSFLLAGGLEHFAGVQIPDAIKNLATNFYGADLFRFGSVDLPADTISMNGIGNYTNYGIRTMVGSEHELFLGTANPMNLLTDTTDNLPEGGWELRSLRVTDDCHACEATWNPSWKQGCSANEWWVEYNITDTAVASASLEVVGRGSVPLKLQWGKWVGSSSYRIVSGAQVILHAEKVGGGSARTQVFAYLIDKEPRTDGCVADGSSGDIGGSGDSAPACWAPSILQGSGANEWWVEYRIGDTAASASLEVVGRSSVPLALQYGKWVGSSAFRIPKGTLVVLHAESAMAQKAVTVPFRYLVDKQPALAPCAAPGAQTAR
jgi:hypothetical protein